MPTTNIEVTNPVNEFDKEKTLIEKSPMAFDEFCLRANISNSTGRRIIAAGLIAYVRIGKRIFVTEDQFQDFLTRHTIQTTS